MRGLRLYSAPAGHVRDEREEHDAMMDERVHVRSRFRSVEDPERFAVYSVHDGDGRDWHSVGAPPTMPPGDHTLIVVREFRRVPLHASALALMLFTARGGRGAAVVAELAHFVERAVSLYQPAYLLLAHSLEQPRIATLVMGVHECAALLAASPSAFSLDALLPELRPLLASDPEWYAYCPETEAPAYAMIAVSPYAV
jgi:hypothetical protein